MSFFNRLEVTKRIKSLERKVRCLYFIIGTLTSITENEYDSHEDAAANGIEVGRAFIASDTNTMGITPGAVLIRKEL